MSKLGILHSRRDCRRGRGQLGAEAGRAAAVLSPTAVRPALSLTAVSRPALSLTAVPACAEPDRGPGLR